MYIYIYCILYIFIYIYVYLCIYIYIYIYIFYYMHNILCFITKALNIAIHNRANYTRMIRKKKQFITYSEFQLNMRHSLQPVHNELMLCVQWDKIFYKQSVQALLVLQ